jgi:hypothetical protein
MYQTRLQDWPDKPFPDNLPTSRRVISLRRSDDLRNWTPQQDMLAPDDQDAPDAEFYVMKAFWHAHRYAAVLLKYYRDPAYPNRHSGVYRRELLLSRDGECWTRPYRTEDFCTHIYAEPFEYEGSLCFIGHSQHAKEMTLFRFRLDGLASCSAAGEGSFWSKPFAAPKDDLVLNADCSSGSLSVGVLDENGFEIEGFGSDRCRFENTSHVGLPLLWGEKRLSNLVDRNIHLHFTLNHARVYSLRRELPAIG